MMRFPTLAFLLAAALTAPPAFSQEGDSTRAAKSDVAEAERPMSIFNEDVRRFRFRLEGMLITAETAEMFMLQYNGRDCPEIIGAYADVKTNALVVVGPPEAEHAIRERLATWMVERQGLYPTPLKVQKRSLKFRRKELLRELAEMQILLVEVEGQKAVDVRARIQSLEDELTVVEKQIQVVNHFIARMRDNGFDKPVATAPR